MNSLWLIKYSIKDLARIFETLCYNSNYRIFANSFCETMYLIPIYSFWICEMKKIQIATANFNFLPNKLNFCCGNYSRKYGSWKVVWICYGWLLCMYIVHPKPFSYLALLVFIVYWLYFRTLTKKDKYKQSYYSLIKKTLSCRPKWIFGRKQVRKNYWRWSDVGSICILYKLNLERI